MSFENRVLWRGMTLYDVISIIPDMELLSMTSFLLKIRSTPTEKLIFISFFIFLASSHLPIWQFSQDLWSNQRPLFLTLGHFQYIVKKSAMPLFLVKVACLGTSVRFRLHYPQFENMTSYSVI